MAGGVGAEGGVGAAAEGRLVVTGDSTAAGADREAGCNAGAAVGGSSCRGLAAGGRGALGGGGAAGGLLRAPCEADWLPGGVWGLGVVRGLAGLQQRCGVDFSSRSISEGARWGWMQPSDFLS